MSASSTAAVPADARRDYLARVETSAVGLLMGASLSCRPRCYDSTSKMLISVTSDGSVAGVYGLGFVLAAAASAAAYVALSAGRRRWAVAGAAIAAPYAPPVYYAPRPVYVAPPVAPVYVAPAPAVYPICPALPPYPYYCR